MTNAQIIAIATVLAVLGGTLINNSRIGDLNSRFTDVNGKIADAKEVLRAELQKETAVIRHLLERNHEALLAELARIDQRVTLLEDRIH